MDPLAALWTVAFHSLRYRAGGVLLTCSAVAISVFVLLGVEHVREEARSSFASTVSGVDLIVGARTTEVNLLLLSVFRIGNATANVSWETVEQITEQDRVDWAVPMSLGDSHRGFTVVGTTRAFFDRYRHGRGRALIFDQGDSFDGTTDVVLGARVAASLNYGLRDSLVLSHGIADTSFTHHDEQPFNVVGILAASGTPVDNALFVSLEAIDAIHADDDAVLEDHDPHAAESREDEEEAHGDDEHEPASGRHEEGHALDAHHNASLADEGHDEHAKHRDEHAPLASVTALMVGLDAPFATLQVQRWINDFPDEALLAILPGVALAQLWELVGSVEATLRGVSALVFVSSLFGLNAMLLASMRERRREIEILRSIGAPSLFVLGLLVIESLLIVSVGVALAIGGLWLTIALINGPLADETGLTLSWQIFGPSSLMVLGVIYLSAFLLSMLPAWQAYRMSRFAGAGAGA